MQYQQQYNHYATQNVAYQHQYTYPQYTSPQYTSPHYTYQQLTCPQYTYQQHNYSQYTNPVNSQPIQQHKYPQYTNPVNSQPIQPQNETKPSQPRISPKYHSPPDSSATTPASTPEMSSVKTSQHPPTQVMPMYMPYPVTISTLDDLKLFRPENIDRITVRNHYKDIKSTILNYWNFSSRNSIQRFLHNNIMKRHERYFGTFIFLLQSRDIDWNQYDIAATMAVNSSPSSLFPTLERFSRAHCEMPPKDFIESWISIFDVFIEFEPSSKTLELILRTLIQRFHITVELATVLPEFSLNLSNMTFGSISHSMFYCKNIPQTWEKVKALLREKAVEIAFKSPIRGKLNIES